MILGSVFVLYQNKKLTTYKITNINNPIALDNSASVATPAASAIATPQASNANNINKNSDFNLDIFSSDKFKNLRETTFIIKEQPEVGKRDPFKPN